MAAAVAALLALAPTTPALDGRNAVTQYAWASANCTGPIVGVLATYRLNECTESVYPGVFLYITWVRDPLTQMPDAIMYSHYQDPQCQVRRSMHQGFLNPRNLVFYPFFTQFPPSFAHSQRLDARNPGSTARSPGENGKKSGKIVENRGN